jgi:hypothetical protein
MTTFRHKIKPLSFGVQNGYIGLAFPSLNYTTGRRCPGGLWPEKLLPGGGKMKKPRAAAKYKAGRISPKAGRDG